MTVFSLTAIVILLLNIETALTSCSFVGSPTGIPPKKLPKPAPPFLIKDARACPYYNNSYGCCNDIQLHQLETNFQDLELVFGEDCPVCAVNQKIFWCEFTCNPNQSDYGTNLHIKSL
jgi:hypothetical protein